MKLKRSSCIHKSCTPVCNLLKEPSRALLCWRRADQLLAWSRTLWSLLVLPEDPRTLATSQSQVSSASAFPSSASSGPFFILRDDGCLLLGIVWKVKSEDHVGRLTLRCCMVWYNTHWELIGPYVELRLERQQIAIICETYIRSNAERPLHFYKIAPSQNAEENEQFHQMRWERQGILGGSSQDGIGGSVSVLVGFLSENSLN